jgi:hypothetical protein
VVWHYRPRTPPNGVSHVPNSQNEREGVQKSCDTEVLEYRRRMEDMQVEFTQMLRDTLDKVLCKMVLFEMFLRRVGGVLTQMLKDMFNS